MSEIETRQFLANGDGQAGRAGGARVGGPRRGRQMVDLKFCDLLGSWQHMTLPVDGVRRVGLRRGARLRRLVDPRLAGDLRVGHAADAAGGDGDPRPVHRGAHALARLRDPRPGHARAVHARPAPRRPPRRGAPARDRHRRHRVLRPRVRVLRLRRGLVRARPEPLALRGRLRRGPLELRQAGARLHGAREGGLLPARAARHAARPAHARWCSRWSGSASRASSTTTRWRPAASARSTSASSR